MYKSLHTIGHLVKMFPGAAPYESILSELVRGWESKRHEFPIPSLRPTTASQGSDVTTKVSPRGEDRPLTRNINHNNLDMQHQHMDWGIPTNHTSQSSSVDTEWMALLNNSAFDQASNNNNGHPMLNGQSSGSGSSSHGHGQNGQQTLTEDMGTSWTPLFGSPRSTEAFSDQWAGTLIQMGGQVTGPVRDDFFS
jgi:hypothetical protein